VTIQVYFSHSYRDRAINAPFLEQFVDEEIPLVADQKSDVWCVAKLERYMRETAGFVSIIPRRGSETDPGSYSPYIGYELNLARRARVPRQLGISFDSSLSGSVQNVQYTSSEGTNVQLMASSAVTGVAKGEIKIEFARSGAFVFHASNLQERQLANRIAVAKAIIAAYKRGRWREEWLLIDAHHIASRVTVIVSEDSSASLALAAEASGPLNSISLADPKVGLTVSRTTGKIVHFIGAKDLHPLYSCLRVKDPVFGSSTVEAVRGGAGDGAAGELFARPSIDELLNS
jgi:hypothetical protein